MTLSLHHHDMRCDIRADLGACIAGLWLGDTPVLRSTPADELSSVRASGCYPLVPYSNRMAQARLVWSGTSHPLVRNFNDEPHAIHGVGWLRAWTVLDQTDDSALLSFEHQPDSHWPFAFDVSQAFALKEGALHVSLSITNQSPQPAPVGLGWHPYFVKRAYSQLSFAATGRWDMGQDKLPTVQRPVQGLQVQADALDIDNCFDGWSGTATLQDAVLQVGLASSLKHVVVYTKPDLPVLAIEPVSHVNNALNMASSLHAASRVVGGSVAQPDALGLRVAQPGETFHAQMVISAQRTGA